jgi:hypothetical protein
MELIHLISIDTDNLVRTLWTDDDGEWSSKVFSTWMIRKAICNETIAPHTTQKDGVSERGICTVTEGNRSCLYDHIQPHEPFPDPVTNETVKLIRESRLL